MIENIIALIVIVIAFILVVIYAWRVIRRVNYDRLKRIKETYAPFNYYHCSGCGKPINYSLINEYNLIICSENCLEIVAEEYRALN